MGLALDATSVLDREMFHEEKEDAWRNHFEELSDRKLQALNPEVFCGGYLDLVARRRRAYEDEVARRNLEPGDPRTRAAGTVCADVSYGAGRLDVKSGQFCRACSKVVFRTQYW